MPRAKPAVDASQLPRRRCFVCSSRSPSSERSITLGPFATIDSDAFHSILAYLSFQELVASAWGVSHHWNHGALTLKSMDMSFDVRVMPDCRKCRKPHAPRAAAAARLPSSCSHQLDPMLASQLAASHVGGLQFGDMCCSTQMFAPHVSPGHAPTQPQDLARYCRELPALSRLKLVLPLPLLEAPAIQLFPQHIRVLHLIMVDVAKPQDDDSEADFGQVWNRVGIVIASISALVKLQSLVLEFGDLFSGLDWEEDDGGQDVPRPLLIPPSAVLEPLRALSELNEFQWRDLFIGTDDQPLPLGFWAVIRSWPLLTHLSVHDGRLRLAELQMLTAEPSPPLLSNFELRLHDLPDSTEDNKDLDDAHMVCVQRLPLLEQTFWHSANGHSALSWTVTDLSLLSALQRPPTHSIRILDLKIITPAVSASQIMAALREHTQLLSLYVVSSAKWTAAEAKQFHAALPQATLELYEMTTRKQHLFKPVVPAPLRRLLRVRRRKAAVAPSSRIDPIPATAVSLAAPDDSSRRLQAAQWMNDQLTGQHPAHNTARIDEMFSIWPYLSELQQSQLSSHWSSTAATST